MQAFLLQQVLAGGESEGKHPPSTSTNLLFFYHVVSFLSLLLHEHECAADLHDLHFFVLSLNILLFFYHVVSFLSLLLHEHECAADLHDLYFCTEVGGGGEGAQPQQRARNMMLIFCFLFLLSFI